MRIAFSFALVMMLAGCVSEPTKGILSEDFDREEAAKTRVSLGLTYLKNGNYSQAKLNLDRALDFAPRSADVHYSLAYYYQQVGETARADASFNTAIDLAPRNADIANSYGAFLCETGDYDRAKVFFLKAVNNTQYANTAETYENMALCAQGQQRFEEAIEYFQLALNHQPARAKSLMLLAEIYAQTSQWEKAKAVLQRFERVGQITPDYLWLAAKTASGQNDLKTATDYGDMLVAVYPNHPLTARYREESKAWPRVAVRRKVKSSSSTVNAEQPAMIVRAEPEKKPEPESKPAIPVSEPEVPQDETAKTEPATRNDQTVDTDVPQVVNQADKAESSVAPVEQSQNAPVSEKSEGEAAGETELAGESSESKPAESIADDEAPADTAESDEKPRIHVVKNGENLYRISIKYNLKLSVLKEWNRLKDSDSIYVGKRLWLIPPEEQYKK